MNQFSDLETGAVVDEKLYGDLIVRFLHSTVHGHAPSVFKFASDTRLDGLAGWLNFDSRLEAKLLGNRRFWSSRGIDLGECVHPPEWHDTPRKIFERQIRYWECRPMDESPVSVVSPCDGRLCAGSLERGSPTFTKRMFFDLGELLGPAARRFRGRFEGGDYAVFRLTPEHYHYNHSPVAGRVLLFDELSGESNSSNPYAMVDLVSPLSKNRRAVTLLNTDVTGGTGIGLVAMVEVTALMTGQVQQAYHPRRYLNPRPLDRGLFLRKGSPKSLYRPGSGATVLIFEPGRIRFCAEVEAGSKRSGNRDRLSDTERPIVETAVRLRSTVAYRA